MTFPNSHLLIAQESVAPTSAPPAGGDADGAPAGKTGSQFSMLPIFGLMLVMMYFVMIRPQQKRAKEHKQRIESLKIGSKVISAGGIHGLVTNLSDKTVTVKVSDNSKIKFEKASITQVFGGDDGPEDSDDSAEANDGSLAST